MPAIATGLAVKAFPRGGVIPMSVPWSIPVGPSASTVRRQNACTIQTTNAMQSMWISRAAELVTVGRRPAQRSERPELFKFGLAELLVNRLPVLYFYITINMLDASRLACVLV